MDKGRPLPKFGEWDVNDPASADGFTMIFNKARSERKAAGTQNYETNAASREEINNSKQDGSKTNSRKWLCCIAPAES